MKKILYFIMMISLSIIMYGCSGARDEDAGGVLDDKEHGKHMVIETAKGEIDILLYDKDAPKTVENLYKLTNRKFYDGITFHRVEPGKFVIGGDPLGTGDGSPGYTLKAEIKEGLEHSTGTVSMARLPDYVNPTKMSSGSQFFICLSSQAHFNGEYTIFGQVTEESMETVFLIEPGDVMEKVYIEEK